jgi:hypothetical protein
MFAQPKLVIFKLCFCFMIFFLVNIKIYKLFFGWTEIKQSQSNKMLSF